MKACEVLQQDFFTNPLSYLAKGIIRGKTKTNKWDSAKLTDFAQCSGMHSVVDFKWNKNTGDSISVKHHSS